MVNGKLQHFVNSTPPPSPIDRQGDMHRAADMVGHVVERAGGRREVEKGEKEKEEEEEDVRYKLANLDILTIHIFVNCFSN